MTTILGFTATDEIVPVRPATSHKATIPLRDGRQATVEVRPYPTADKPGDLVAGVRVAGVYVCAFGPTVEIATVKLVAAVHAQVEAMQAFLDAVEGDVRSEAAE